MRKRSKSISLSNDLTKKVRKILRKEQSEAIDKDEPTPNFSIIIERLLWEALEARGIKRESTNKFLHHTLDSEQKYYDPKGDRID